MKCSKCGSEVKNLPEYIQDIGTEVLCTKCAGTENDSDDPSPVYDKFRYYSKGYALSSDELDSAA